MTHKEIIKTDVDSSLLPQWQKEYIKTREAILKSQGYELERVIIRPSGESLPWIEQKTKGKGFHCWWHILCAHELADMEKLQLQFLLGDDLGRIWINYLRITQRNNPNWDKIFGYVTWRTELEERCKNCNLRRIIKEISGIGLFEYGGLWLHATDKHAENWKRRVGLLIPPAEDFHLQLIICRQLGLESKVLEG